MVFLLKFKICGKNIYALLVTIWCLCLTGAGWWREIIATKKPSRSSGTKTSPNKVSLLISALTGLILFQALCVPL